MGIGQQGLVRIPSQGRGTIDLQMLDDQILRDRKSGDLPFAVVANGGTTGTGAIDDISGLADICQRHKLWLHVDACYGGGALLLEPGLPEFEGLSRADSIAIDPHKWFFVPMTAGILLTPHRELEQDMFDVAASYIPGDGIINTFRRGIPTSRRSTGLTVWMILRAHGWNVIRQSIERNVFLTRMLEDRLREAGFRVLGDGQLSVACARWEATGFDERGLDDLQSAIAQAVVATGRGVVQYGQARRRHLVENESGQHPHAGASHRNAGSVDRIPCP